MPENDLSGRQRWLLDCRVGCVSRDATARNSTQTQRRSFTFVLCLLHILLTNKPKQKHGVSRFSSPIIEIFEAVRHHSLVRPIMPAQCKSAKKRDDVALQGRINVSRSNATQLQWENRCIAIHCGCPPQRSLPVSVSLYDHFNFLPITNVLLSSLLSSHSFLTAVLAISCNHPGLSVSVTWPCYFQPPTPTTDAMSLYPRPANSGHPAYPALPRKCSGQLSCKALSGQPAAALFLRRQPCSVSSVQ